MELQDFKKQFEWSFKEARTRGYSIKNIKAKLIKQGYNQETLNKLILKHYSTRATLVFGALVLIVGLLLLIYYYI